MVLGFFACLRLVLQPLDFQICIFLFFKNSFVSAFFLSHFVSVLKAGCQPILFYTKSWVNRDKVVASRCSSFLLRSKPVHWNYRHFFWNFTPKRVFQELIKVIFLVTTLSIQIFLRLKETMDVVKMKKICVVVFADLWTVL